MVDGLTIVGAHIRVRDHMARYEDILVQDLIQAFKTTFIEEN